MKGKLIIKFIKRFCIVTTTICGKHYFYFIQSQEDKPTKSQIKKWLNQNGNEIEKGKCSELVESIIEIEFFNQI